MLKKYYFLISQLVSRDFKIKYKRSFLGVLWSLLNPLLTMGVQYVIFSSLFRFDITNYAVYLLIGIVVFGFLTDTTTQSLTTIIENSSLITKVYVPRYIYPISRIISCSINFMFSCTALIIVLVITGETINSNYIFLIFMIVTLLGFVTGISLALSSLMVFFRDIQFLYSVFLTLWTYATPIFYPETILPENLRIILKINPMYYFITFGREVILNNTCPSVQIWIACLFISVTSLLYGMFIFKNLEDKFIFYL